MPDGTPFDEDSPLRGEYEVTTEENATDTEIQEGHEGEMVVVFQFIHYSLVLDNANEWRVI